LLHVSYILVISKVKVQTNQKFKINVFWKENLINWFYSESDKSSVPEGSID